MIYLDNSATSFPKAPGVGDRMAQYILHNGANIGRASYGPAMDAGAVAYGVREKLCRLFNFTHPSCAVFTFGATAALNTVIRGFVRPGDRVVVSALEHNSVMRPLMRSGAETLNIPADREGNTRASDMEPLIAGARLVILSHASNVCGAVLQIEEMAGMCVSKGVPLVLDAAQSAGLADIDFSSLGLAALCVPGHKGLLGPQGIGAMLVSPDFAARVEPLLSGGTGSASHSEEQPPFMPDKFESGTLNIPGIYGLDAALDLVLSEGAAAIGARVGEVAARFMKGIAGAEGLRVIRPQRNIGVVSVDFTLMDNAEAAFTLEGEYGILTRCGLHCAPSAHRALGTFPKGTVRFSFGHCNTADDADAAAEAVRRIVRQAATR